MKLALISPRLAIQKNDFLGSGVPYWPLELATFAAYLRSNGEQPVLLDLFGADPERLSDEGDHYLQGVAVEDSRWQDQLANAEVFLIFAISYMSHVETRAITRWLKQRYSDRPVAVLENSQAVTGYAIDEVFASFFAAGADLLVCGEPYFNWPEIRANIVKLISSPHAAINVNDLAINVMWKSSPRRPIRITDKSASYPIPAWDLVNLEAYWRLPYSHGPKTPKFLPILTSRGCPYPCDFCVVPKTNNQRWRGNTPEEVVAEMLALRNEFGVRDFQIEDLNPTVQHARWERICELLIEHNLGIRFYFVSGTKAETLRIDQIPQFAKAGCRYISISPESGSDDLMKIIGKKFQQPHGIQLVRACRQFGIRTQACFLVGHPAESAVDHLHSKTYLLQLLKAGLDEVAVFIVAPFAGSKLFARNAIKLKNQQSLPSFSPQGRSDYQTLEYRRKDLIKTFFLGKLQQGVALWMQGFRALFGTPQTKMENLPKRILYVNWLILKNRFLVKNR